MAHALNLSFKVVADRARFLCRVPVLRARTHTHTHSIFAVAIRLGVVEVFVLEHFSNEIRYE